MDSAPKIESKDLTIEDVYKDFYAVPDYQREYVWAEDDVQIFADPLGQSTASHRTAAAGLPFCRAHAASPAAACGDARAV